MHSECAKYWGDLWVITEHNISRQLNNEMEKKYATWGGGGGV